MSKSMVLALMLCAFVAGFSIAHLINNIWGSRLMSHTTNGHDNIELGCKAEFSKEQGINNIIPGLGEEVSHPVWRIYNGKLQPYAPDVFTDPQKYKENLKHPLKEINGKYYRVNLMDGVAVGDREIPGMPMGRKPKGWGEKK